MKTYQLIIIPIVILFVLTIIFGTFGTIDAGYRGVRTTWGAVSGTLEPGLYVKMPFVQGVEEVNVQTQKEQTDAEASSSDLQVVHTQIALNYNVYSDKVVNLYQEIGIDYKVRVIDPAIQEAVKSATAKYTAEQLITERQAVQDEIKKFLVDRLTSRYIQVTDLSIINFDFSSQFNQAIEAKVTAEQDALAAKNKLDQVKYEADQTVTKATADAEAIKIQAQAINSQGGADYVQLQAIKAWDGHLPTQMIPGGTVPFLNLTK